MILNGNIDYTANTGATGTDSFSYTISDDRGGTASATANGTTLSLGGTGGTIAAGATC